MGWIPHDEGLLGQSAERVLNGEVPHVDFDDPYTGLLSWAHSLAFEYLGISVRSLREFHAFVFVAYQVVLLLLGKHLLKRWSLALAFLWTGSVWAAPCYPASMPTWYVLYTSLTAFFILVRFPRKYWGALSAGFLIGLGILFKITALYSVIAALWFILLLHTIPRKDRVGLNVVDGLVFIGLSLLPIYVIKLNLNIENLSYFSIPSLLVGVICFYNRRIIINKSLIFNLFLLSFGVLIPVSVFAFYYISIGHLNELWNGVWVLPKLRLSYASILPPSLFYQIIAVIVSLFSFKLIGKVLKKCKDCKTLFLVLLIFSLLALLLPHFVIIYTWVWPAIKCMLLTIVILYIFNIKKLRFKRDVLSWLACGGICLLTQFPYAFKIYFTYIAILIFIPFILLLNSSGFRYRYMVTVLFMCFLTLWAIKWVNQGKLYRFVEWSYFDIQSLDSSKYIPRASINLELSNQIVYYNLITFIQSKTVENDYILAFPDAPEVYFLSGRKNPRRTFYDFFENNTTEYVDLLNSEYIKDIDLVVINVAAEFSRNITQQEVDRFVSVYPNAVLINKYLVLWR